MNEFKPEWHEAKSFLVAEFAKHFDFCCGGLSLGLGEFTAANGQ